MIKKRYLKTCLKTAVSTIFLFLVLKQVPLAETKQTLSKTHPILFFSGLMVLIVFSSLNSLRLFIIIKKLVNQSKQKYINVLKAYFIGYFYNLFLPSTVGGDLIKGAYLGNQTISKKIGITASFLDRIAGLGGLAILGLVGTCLAFFVQLPLPFPIILPFILFAGILLGVSFFIIFAEKVFTLTQKTKFSHLFSFLNQLDLGKKKLLFQLLIVSFFLQIFSVIIAILVAQSVSLKLNSLYFCIYVPFLSLILLLPITISGIGLREASAVSLYGSIGVPSEQILAFTTVNFSYTLIVGIIGGVWQALPSRKNN